MLGRKKRVAPEGKESESDQIKPCIQDGPDPTGNKKPLGANSVAWTVPHIQFVFLTLTLMTRT